MPNRRRTLAMLGGGVILAAGTATAVHITRKPTRALEPWDMTGIYTDPRKKALSYAILAPNPHNLQPWLVDLNTPDQITLFRDESKALPETDPLDRQITIGFGCFLEQLKIAATLTGHRTETSLYPEGEGNSKPIATIQFKQGASVDPLSQHMLLRRSTKEPFELKKIEASKIEALKPYAHIYHQADQVSALQKLTWDAWQVEANTPHTHKESVDLMRFGKKEINNNPDGIDIGGPFLNFLMMLGLLSREALLNPNSMSSKSGQDMFKKTMESTPAYAILTSDNNDRVSQIKAGEQWLRLNLKTTELGLCLHPVSQALQEYPEMKSLYQKAHNLMAKEGQTVQMLGRLGYGPTVARTPRWPLEKKLVHA